MRASRALRWARLTAGLSQRQLAERTGLPQSTVGRIEAALVDPRVNTLSRLLRACGYDLEVMDRIGQGIDRSMMRRLLALRPERRLAAAAADARLLAELDRARVGRSPNAG